MAAVPELGRFAAKLSNAKDAPVCELTFEKNKSVPIKASHGNIKGAEAIAPGICMLPNWDGVGALLLYDGREDAWVEFDSANVRIKNKFKRVDEPPKSQPVVNSAHPLDGKF
jgi:hypothetical protein